MGGSREGSSLGPKSRGCQAIALAERLREMRRLAKADQSGNVTHGDRRLLDQQLCGDVQTAREQVLAEGALAELRVGARHLTR